MKIEARAQSFEEALRRAGVRITRQRAALLRVLAGAEDHSVYRFLIQVVY